MALPWPEKCSRKGAVFRIGCFHVQNITQPSPTALKFSAGIGIERLMLVHQRLSRGFQLWSITTRKWSELNHQNSGHVSSVSVVSAFSGFQDAIPVTSFSHCSERVSFAVARLQSGLALFRGNSPSVPM
jgi:hypothetical protein